MTLRSFIFWAHLVAGVISGLAIGIMCFTGVALAFEKELIAWAERDARVVALPAATTSRLPLEELQRRVRETHPEAQPSSIILQNDPRAAIAFSAGRSGGLYVDPYSGDVRQPKSAFVGRFMQTMVEWHRYLGFTGESSRPRGKWVNGICNVAFCVLAITGLYLWMPRTWSWRGLRPVVWFTQNASGKARDWNWHNVIGFWSAPVLIVLTLTAMPISFRWAGNLIYTLTGTEPPPAGSGRSVSTPAEVPPPPPGARLAELDTLIASAQREVPGWKTLTLRLGGSGRGSSRAPSPVTRAPAHGTSIAATLSPERAPRVETGGNAPAVTISIRESGTWPRTATTTLSLDPFTGDVLQREGHADLNAARQVRAWTRFLHTGEALGWAGQLIAGLACAGGCVLVWTGLALAWRRFFRRPAAAK